MRSTWLTVVLALPIAAMPLAAGAQMFTAGGGIAPAMAMNQLMMQPVRESVAQTMARSGGGGGGSSRYLRAPAAAGAFAAGASASVAARTPTDYRASPAVTARVKQQYVDFIRKSVSPQAAQQYEGVLSRSDFVRNWSNLVAEEGLRPGDAVDAFAAYWMLNYLIANNLTDSGAGSGRAVASQIRPIMASNAGFGRLNEGQRQEMAEVLMLNFLTQQAAYDHAVTSRDEALRRRLGEAAVARFRSEMGVDLRQLQLTRAGFVRGG